MERIATYIQSGGQKCGVCIKKCPKECIHLETKKKQL
jgi:Na+-translocating ferredoxin:NAD+ oxidoreductase RNF subunit RnfB